MEWAKDEIPNLPEAKRRKRCALNLEWKCSHWKCQKLWKLTPDTATEQERAILWPLSAIGNE